ncbi:MAG: hypothetical protein P8X96_23425 [Desulfobacteraceae bacterium]
MRKLLVLLMVLALVSPAMAASKVSISGHYQVSAVTADNIVDQNAQTDTGDADKRDYIYQRFRVQPVIQASDAVKATLRFDFAEGQWGQDQDFTTARAVDTGVSGELQVDRAYADVNMGWLNVRAGLQFIYAGQTQVYRDNQPGLQFMIKTPSPVGFRLAYVKASEGIGVGSPFDRLSDETDVNEDTDRYLGDLSINTDPVKLNIFYVMQKDDGTDGVTDFKDEPWVAGLRVRSMLGSVSIAGEVATFGGDNGNGTDYVGTQANVNGMMKFSDALTVGMDLIYSTAQGANEQKITAIGNPFARLDVVSGGSFGWDTLTYGRNNAPVFAGLPVDGDVFDPFRTGAGCIGAGIGAKFVPVQKVTLIGQFHYMVADDDNIQGVTGEFEDGYNALVAAVFQLAPKASLHATYQYIDANFADNVDIDNAYIATLWMNIAF